MCLLHRFSSATNRSEGGRQKEALEAITADIDNIRTAWRHAIERKDTRALEQAAECFCLYCEMRGALHEGEAAFQQAVATFTSTPADDPATAKEQDALTGFLLVDRACCGRIEVN